MEKTLSFCVEAARCRKGKAAGTTKRGAYWLACEPIILRRAGGDGIGQSAPGITWRLELRHFRGGEVRPTLHREGWHQNGSSDDYYGRPELATTRTVEEVIVILKAGANNETCYSDYYVDKLTAALVDLGLPESEPGPDA